MRFAGVTWRPGATLEVCHGWIDLAELKSRMPPLPTEPLYPAMNSIAWDAAGRRLFVAGKLWPKVFEIRVRPEVK